MTSRELPAPDNPEPRGAAVGRATNGDGGTIHFSDDLMRGHHLYVGRVGMGKSTMLSHLTRHLMSEIASGRSDRSLVVMNPHSDLMSIVLGNVPPELIPSVKLVELGNPDWVPAINPLDTEIFRDRDQVSDTIVNASMTIWYDREPRQQHTLSRGFRQQHTLSQALKSLYEANAHSSTKREDQYTLLDIPKFLNDGTFRDQVLSQVVDMSLVHWWINTFGQLARHEKEKVVHSVISGLDTCFYSLHACAILGEPVCTPDIRATIEQGGILLVSADPTYAGPAAASLIGSTILSLVNSIMQEQLRKLDGRVVSVIADDIEVMPADYATLMHISGRIGGNVILATQNISRMATGNSDVKDIILSKVSCLSVFQVSSADARELIPQLGQEHLTETDLTQQPPHRCYVSLRGQ